MTNSEITIKFPDDSSSNYQKYISKYTDFRFLSGSLLCSSIWCSISRFGITIEKKKETEKGVSNIGLENYNKFYLKEIIKFFNKFNQNAFKS